MTFWTLVEIGSEISKLVTIIKLLELKTHFEV